MIISGNQVKGVIFGATTTWETFKIAAGNAAAF